MEMLQVLIHSHPARQCDHGIAAVKDQVDVCVCANALIKTKSSADWTIEKAFWNAFYPLKMSSILHENRKNGIDQLNADYCHRKMISFTHSTEWEAKQPIQPAIFLSHEETRNNTMKLIEFNLWRKHTARIAHSKSSHKSMNRSGNRPCVFVLCALCARDSEWVNDWIIEKR